MSVNTLVSQTEINRSSLDKNNGLGAYIVLVGADGIVDAKMVNGKFGLVWLLTDEEEEIYGRKFIPTDHSHLNKEFQMCGESRIQKDFGLQQMLELAPSRLSRKGDIIRLDWKEYGKWNGYANWDEGHNIFNPELIEEVKHAK